MQYPDRGGDDLPSSVGAAAERLTPAEQGLPGDDGCRVAVLSELNRQITMLESPADAGR